MAFCHHLRSRTVTGTAGITLLLLLILTLSGGCLRAEPEELPTQPALMTTVIPLVPPVSPNTTENTGSAYQAIIITGPKLTGVFTLQEYPPDVERAVRDFSEGKTTDTINGFLRWESVRARTNQSDTARVLSQIHRIDYAVFNTTVKENLSLYTGISGEQVKRVRNESVYEEKGYLIASYDPSVIYHRFADSGRDAEGYLTMGVIEARRGDRLLFVNTTEREFLLPRGSIRDVAREEEHETVQFSRDSVPRYGDPVLKNVRLIYTKEHP